MAKIYLLINQALRYLAGSVIATSIDMIILYQLTTKLGLPYTISAIFGYSFGMLLNYLNSILWVFPDRRFESRTIEFSAFTAIGIMGLGLTEIILYLCIDRLNIHIMMAKLLAVFIVFIWNFGMRKTLVFSRRETEAG